MSKLNKYKIFPELNLLIEFFHGKFGLKELKELKIEEVKEKDYNPNINALVDLRESEPLFNENEIIDYINFVKQNKKIPGSRYSALLTNNPRDLKTSLIYILLGKSLPMKFEIFSTLEASLKWIGIAESNYGLINDVLEEFRHSAT